MYKSVYELTQDELDELKVELFNDPEFDEVSDGEVDCPEDIPNDWVLSHWADTNFTEDDFFCNLKED